jgi:D-tyrosyl-tRNA(Tyr) deacylase
VLSLYHLLVRAVAQRVTEARVIVDGEVVGEIGEGLVALVGVACEDTDEDARYIADKLAHLRVFPDEHGRLERSVLETGGAVLLVSQFTLMGDARKGRRPSYAHAARGEIAEARYLAVAQWLRAMGVPVATGRFAAEMHIPMAAHGPVTILLDSRRTF